MTRLNRLGWPRRAVLGLVVAAIVAWVGVGPAVAAPASTSTAVAGKTLPKGLPTDLRKYIAGTDEFKAAPWFKGACAEKGGDVAGYINALFRDEPRMNYWRLPDEARADYLMEKSKWSKERATKAVASGFVPTGHMLNDTYPGPRTSDDPSTTPVCAEDFQSWTSKTLSAWGFQWSEKPDDTSLDRMETVGGDKGKDLRKRVLDPCGADIKGGSSFCDHAFFVNCDQVTEKTSQNSCISWNEGVARLYLGTANWVEKNLSFTDRLWYTTGLSDGVKGGKAISSAFAGMWHAAGEVLDFVKDPADQAGKWANTIKAGAMDMVQTVLPGLATVGDFDFKATWFLKWYALSIPLGMAVMVVMFMLATVMAARRGGAGMLARDALGYLPMGLALMIYTPALAAVLQGLAHALTATIIKQMGASVDTAVTNVSAMLGGLTDKTLVGGVFMGIIGFACLFFGAFALYVGLLMHQIGIPIATVACAIGYGMMVHPSWRRKALRVPLMLMSLILSTPLLFLLLWGIMLVIINSSGSSTVGEGKLTSLGALALCALAFVVVGLAPFSLLKWSPLLPNSEDADRMGDSGGGSGQVIGAGMGGAVGASRRGHEGSSGGGGASSGGSRAGSSGADAKHAVNSGRQHTGGGGGQHRAGGGLGKAAMVAGALGGPVTGTAARLASAAGKGTAHMTRGAVSAGTKASAIAASNRVHGVAANSAPTERNS